MVVSEPDRVIICTNTEDDFSYIDRIKAYLESYFLTKVIALVIYPFKKSYEWNLNNGDNIDAIQSEIAEYKNQCQLRYNMGYI